MNRTFVAFASLSVLAVFLAIPTHKPAVDPATAISQAKREAEHQASDAREAQERTVAYTSPDRVVPVESNAVFVGTGVDANVKLADFMAIQIHSSGFRCDSIASVLANTFHPGFTVQCNHYHYTYHVEDRGGTWVARIDE